jgi:hypothetical protein
MSGITSFDDGDRFIFRVYSDLGSTQGPRWSNSYEAYAHAGGSITDLTALGGKLALFNQGMSGSDVRITGYSVSTWVPDSTPYNPENFYVSPALNLTGSRTMSDPIDLDVCLDVRRSVALGRSGNIYLRGALDEADVERSGSKYTLTDPQGLDVIFNAVLAATHLPYYYLGGTMVPIWLGLIGANIIGTVYTRGLTNIAIRGVTIVPMNHRWYNQPNRSALAAARKVARVERKLAATSDLLKV